MAKEPDEVIQADIDALEEGFNQFVSSRRTMQFFAESIKKRVITRTAAGFGVAIGGRQTRLPALSDSYKDQRKGKIRFFKNKKTKGTFTSREPEDTRVVNKSKFFRPSKANNSATGLLLRSLKATSKKAKLVVTLLRKSYTRNIFGERIKRINTIKVNAFLESQGRTWFDLTNPQNKLLRLDILKALDRFLANKLNL